jgi:hypothetical protein
MAVIGFLARKFLSTQVFEWIIGMQVRMDRRIVFFGRFILGFLILITLLCAGGDGWAGRSIDINIRQVPEPAPAVERLALALRLYDRDRLSEAAKLAGPLAQEQVAESAEALFLLGRMAFTRGKPHDCIRRFQKVFDYYPGSDVVQDGRLADKCTEAVDVLLTAERFAGVGRFLDLLTTIDPPAVAAVAKKLEKRVDQEAAAFHQSVASLTLDSSEALKEWAEATYGSARIRRVGHCRRDDGGCAADNRRRAEGIQAEMKAKDRKRWAAAFAPQYFRLKARLANGALEKAQAYSLLRRLATDALLTGAVKPGAVEGLPAPFAYEIRVTDYEKYESGLKKYTRGLQPYRRWAVYRWLAPERVAAIQGPVLGLGPLDRNQLLERLRKLLYSAPSRSGLSKIQYKL